MVILETECCGTLSIREADVESVSSNPQTRSKRRRYESRIKMVSGEEHYCKQTVHEITEVLNDAERLQREGRVEDSK